MDSTKTSTQCENSSLRQSRSSLQSLSLWELLQRFATQKLRHLLVRAFRGFAASLTALTLSLETNKRAYAAVTLMLVAAPLSSISYLLFDSGAVDKTWYYQSYYNLLYVLSPRLFEVLTFTGIFLLFPAGSQRAWFLLIPIGLSVSKILWLLTVTSNQEFHQIVPFFFLLVAALISTVWLFTFEWMMHRHFHEKEAKVRRLVGIRGAVKGQNIRREESLPLYEKVIDEMEIESMSHA